MLGGGHFRKKEEKARRKAAKRESAPGRDGAKQATKSSSGGGTTFSFTPGRGQHLQQNAPGSSKSNSGGSGTGSTKNTNMSTLKGPIVSYEYGASRDSANDRKNVPFANKQAERAYRRQKRIPQHALVVDPEKGNAAKATMASSAAQRRRVLKHRKDDDLLDHFREKLNASTFRLLNEQLYNSPNAFAGQLLRDPATFADYHTGYRQQLVQWPVNPNQLVVEAVLGDRRGRWLGNKSKTMPGHIPPSWVIADMGCGDAQIAAALKPKGYTVHSFDFCAVNDNVTVADSANVPLEKDSVDICVFSLSLMATDYEKSLFEAFRILKPKRLLKIVEVRSRIPFPHRFAEMVSDIGFECDYQDVMGDYFVIFDFVKKDGQAEANREVRHAPGDVLVPSMYKKR